MQTCGKCGIAKSGNLLAVLPLNSSQDSSEDQPHPITIQDVTCTPSLPVSGPPALILKYPQHSRDNSREGVPQHSSANAVTTQPVQSPTDPSCLQKTGVEPPRAPLKALPLIQHGPALPGEQRKGA